MAEKKKILVVAAGHRVAPVDAAAGITGGLPFAFAPEAAWPASCAAAE